MKRRIPDRRPGAGKMCDGSWVGGTGVFPGQGVEGEAGGSGLAAGRAPSLALSIVFPKPTSDPGSPGLLFPSLSEFSTVCYTHTAKGFSVVNEADVFLEFSCFFYDPMDVGNLISGPSAFINPA